MSSERPRTHGARIVILGAGPTGLGAAHRLEQNGHANWTLLEAQPEAGGLAASFNDDQGFTWDVGGHVQFSHYAYFDAVMQKFLGAEGWLQHQRESWVWMRERFIPYPLQNHIHHLPQDEQALCLQGLFESAAHPQTRPENFAQWIAAAFGAGLADVFMRPYNCKVWAQPLESMSANWVGERVAAVDLDTALKNQTLRKDSRAWGPNSSFQFPRQGGTGAIWRACAQQLPAENVYFSSAVHHIDLDNKEVHTENGKTFTYDILISSLSLRTLIRLTGQTQLESIAGQGLRYSSTNIVGLGLRGKPSAQLAKKCWIYFPEDNCPFYRVTVFSNYSPNNVPDPALHWSLMCEVSESHHRPVKASTLLEAVIQGAMNTQLIQCREEIISTWRYRAEFGYPTPGLHRDAALACILPHFERHNVFSRGRFGLWKYEVSNQDHCFMQGVELVERLMHGRTEITAFDPVHANSKKHPWPFERWQESTQSNAARPADCA